MKCIQDKTAVSLSVGDTLDQGILATCVKVHTVWDEFAASHDAQKLEGGREPGWIVDTTRFQPVSPASVQSGKQ